MGGGAVSLRSHSPEGGRMVINFPQNVNYIKKKFMPLGGLDNKAMNHAGEATLGRE